MTLLTETLGWRIGAHEVVRVQLGKWNTDNIRFQLDRGSAGCKAATLAKWPCPRGTVGVDDSMGVF